ncbi:MAG: branched-chain amino acid aminotransferase [Pseudomonadota bacterium]
MAFGKTIWTWFEGSWHQGNFPIMGAADHGAWQGTMVFDGARAFEGTAPDLDLHCARVNASADVMGLNKVMQDGEILEIAREGIAKYSGDAELYVRPMMWSRNANASMVMADPDSTAFAMCLEDIAMPAPNGISVTITEFTRPMYTMAPTNAKAACLYPNNARMLRSARARGFDNAISLDPLGNVAETATANIWMVKDGVAMTPAPNGTFLNGITRQRVLKLLRGAGIEAVETTITLPQLREADEIFSTGNAQKVMPVIRFDDRELEYGPVTRRARELYWEFAHANA